MASEKDVKKGGTEGVDTLAQARSDLGLAAESKLAHDAAESTPSADEPGLQANSKPKVRPMEEGPHEFSEETESVSARRTAKYISDLVSSGFEPEKIEKIISRDIKNIIRENTELDNKEVIFLYDNDQIGRFHASNIYQHLSSLETRKDIYLILRSPGGEVESAYLISKMCNRFKKDKFIIGIPAEAKSAATLLSLGGDEIHMGAMSELGPIDPQINDFPALAFSGALEKITQLAQKYPEAANMLANYLIGSALDVRALGHYERITESATQYALRLLKSKVTSTDENVAELEKLAGHFTNHYKDHNFVIDIDEAQELLSTEVVKADTKFYETCHEVHKYLETFEQVMAYRRISKKISILGCIAYLTSK